MPDQSIGVRELRDRLNSVVARVEAGETVIVTKRGRPVARIVPAAASPALARLLEQGRAAWSGARPPELPEPIRLRGQGPTLADLVSEGRR